MRRKGDDELQQLLIQSPQSQELEQLFYYDETGTLYLWGEITDELGAQVCDLAIREGRNFRLVIINSMGGDVPASFAIGDVIESLKVDTVALGQAYSMGAYLFSLGKKRYTLPSTSFLIHAGSASLGNISFSNAKYFQEFWDKEITNKVLETIIKKIKGKERKKLKHEIISGKEYYFDAKHALDMGFATEIITFGGLLKKIYMEEN